MKTILFIKLVTKKYNNITNKIEYFKFEKGYLLTASILTATGPRA